MQARSAYSKKLLAIAGVATLFFFAGGALRINAPAAVADTIKSVLVVNPASNPANVVSKDATSFTTYFRTFTTDNLGQIFLTGILDERGFDKVSLEIVQFPTTVPNMVVTVDIGKISGTTLSSFVDSFPLGTAATIHTYDANGPDFSLVLTGGPPNTAVGIQAWVYFH